MRLCLNKAVLLLVICGILYEQKKLAKRVSSGCAKRKQTGMERTTMISWNSNLYVGDTMKKKKDKVISSINKREATFGVYCIAFASHPDNLFDILNANELLFPFYKNTQVHILGLAKGKEEAIDLVHRMLMEVYNKTGEFKVREYFIA